MPELLSAWVPKYLWNSGFNRIWGSRSHRPRKKESWFFYKFLFSHNSWIHWITYTSDLSWQVFINKRHLKGVDGKGVGWVETQRLVKRDCRGEVGEPPSGEPARAVPHSRSLELWFLKHAPQGVHVLLDGAWGLLIVVGVLLGVAFVLLL
jgi:hypothetical protein